MTQAAEDFVKIPKSEYFALKNIYELNKKQQEYIRIYEVEQNLKNWNYKKVKIDDFIDSI